MGRDRILRAAALCLYRMLHFLLFLFIGASLRCRHGAEWIDCAVLLFFPTLMFLRFEIDACTLLLPVFNLLKKKFVAKAHELILNLTECLWGNTYLSSLEFRFPVLKYRSR